MSRLQILVVGITIALNALDGFDILSISFASPGIATEWGIDRAALGIVLSMELIGMAIGSIVLGGVADKIGRRPTILGCLAVMSFGMLMATTVTGPRRSVDLAGRHRPGDRRDARGDQRRRRRILEHPAPAPERVADVHRVSARRRVRRHSWRRGSCRATTGARSSTSGRRVTAVLIPITYFVMPESVHWLARKQPKGALEKINRAMARMGHPATTALPTMATPTCDSVRSSDIFAPGLIGVTVIVALAYFFHITTFYFILKWVPKIVADFGFAASSAAGVLVWTNVGGALGGTVLGLLTLRFGVKGLTIVVMLLSTVMVALFGRTPPDLQQLSMICAAAGFCTNAAIVGMYAIIAQVFPTHVRASGTGFAVGVGRGGSVLAPIIAGFLFTAGYTLPTVALTDVGRITRGGGHSQFPEARDRIRPPRLVPSAE